MREAWPVIFLLAQRPACHRLACRADLSRKSLIKPSLEGSFRTMPGRQFNRIVDVETTRCFHNAYKYMFSNLHQWKWSKDQSANLGQSQKFLGVGLHTKCIFY